MERVSTRLQTLIDRIRTAAYGYAGFFDLQRVKEPELDRLAAFDKALVRPIGALLAASTVCRRPIQPSRHQRSDPGHADLLAEVNHTFGRHAEALQAAADHKA